jgi:hypothetical protein
MGKKKSPAQTRVLLDTSFLISFANPLRPHHAVAVEWFRHCVKNRIPLGLSTIVAAEFEMNERITDLPLRNFHVVPFNMPHAQKAGSFQNLLRDRDPADKRNVVINDLKILAQAEVEQFGMILTEDANTLTKYANRLGEAGLGNVKALLLKEGFAPGRLQDPDQTEMDLRG